MVSARSMAAGAVTVSTEWGIVCVSEAAASIASVGATASFRAGMRVADSVSFGLLAGSFGGSFPAISFTSAMPCSDHGLQSWVMTSSKVDQTTSAVIRLADGLAWLPCGPLLALASQTATQFVRRPGVPSLALNAGVADRIQHRADGVA